MNNSETNFCDHDLTASFVLLNSGQLDSMSMISLDIEKQIKSNLYFLYSLHPLCFLKAILST